MYASKKHRRTRSTLRKTVTRSAEFFRNAQLDRPGVRSQHSGTDMTENRVGPLGLVEVANIMIHDDDDDDDDDDGWDG
ncbi:hypothetical protein BELL_0023g00220 [Botrytis elliptica]|uniref:Uncharacterized protein n=1 Tax=Botrytis elliptica TaxID=278938 RepID=A0A4Z1K0X0_9HELO|nr:hypothetical protein EAE99_003981 [Botrytis elliptica]TGO79779.1 hypothetical protein BELL_0023g00220 [Botrytis elliptica]